MTWPSFWLLQSATQRLFVDHPDRATTQQTVQSTESTQTHTSTRGNPLGPHSAGEGSNGEVEKVSDGLRRSARCVQHAVRKATEAPRERTVGLVLRCSRRTVRPNVVLVVAAGSSGQPLNSRQWWRQQQQQQHQQHQQQQQQQQQRECAAEVRAVLWLRAPQRNTGSRSGGGSSSSSSTDQRASCEQVVGYNGDYRSSSVGGRLVCFLLSSKKVAINIFQNGANGATVDSC